MESLALAVAAIVLATVAICVASLASIAFRSKRAAVITGIAAIAASVWWFASLGRLSPMSVVPLACGLAAIWSSLRK